MLEMRASRFPLHDVSTEDVALGPGVDVDADDEGRETARASELEVVVVRFAPPAPTEALAPPVPPRVALLDRRLETEEDGADRRFRSEERRVGKEWRARWSSYHEANNKTLSATA